MSMQLTRLEWNTIGKARVEVRREVKRKEARLLIADVYDGQGKLSTSHRARVNDQDEVFNLAFKIQPLIHGQPGTSGMVRDVFRLIKTLAD